ncbi:MAG TPA: AmmeMemoRadiSam system protein A [Casimicrobiaceae bacterium]|nr:AmmeMemoRadiSam system protein A [Casimicrobiaceae bacterium]
MIDDNLGRALLKTARHAIGVELGRSLGEWPEHEALLAHGATFVTLFRLGELRGCIGTLKAHRPLGADVRANALAAAFHDPRFPALNHGEFDDLSVEVSLLSPAERINVVDEEQLLARLNRGVDGVIIEYDGQRATFLPQVWATLPEPRDFIVELKRKAGMPDDFWSATVNVFRYGVTKWKESELAAARDTV